jgi:GT2 family glycosyltransferase
MRQSLSLIVCTYRRATAVRKLLESLSAQTAPPDEILVIDGSEDSETESVVGGSAIANYFRVPPEHRGLTRQRNYGIARAHCDIVAFLDDDTIPEPGYFEEIRACFRRHPKAAGVGGYIGGPRWRQANPREKGGIGVFRCGGWDRREDYRWRLRKILRLGGDSRPGWMPSFGHSRSVAFLPPDGADHQVEFLFGGASAWLREVLEDHRFSTFFEGYGLYEDLSFSLDVSKTSPLYVCTAARLAHHHEAGGRPNAFRYGRMVVRNGWYVWRQRWPHPSARDRMLWWAITSLLILCRLMDARLGGLSGSVEEALGRIAGGISIVLERRDMSPHAGILYERQ